MAEYTAIAWCHHTRNFWEGCTKISPGCDNCYAAVRDHRFFDSAHWGAGAPRLAHLVNTWREIEKWDRAAGRAGERRRVFINSLSDFFDNEVPWLWRWIAWRVIRSCRNLDFLLLTKRIGNVPDMLPADWGDGYPNVWLGITVVNQAEANRDIPKHLAVPARLRFLSIEPQLGPISLPGFDASSSWCPICRAIVPDSLTVPHELAHPGVSVMEQFDPAKHCIDVPALLRWVIVGGESGRGARYFDVQWARDLRDQCKAAGVSFFLKQLGAWPIDDARESNFTVGDGKRGRPIHMTKHRAGADPLEWPTDLQIQEFPRVQ